MTACLLVVCEAAADFRTASELVDRVLCERVEWLEPTLLPSVRQWWEYDSEHPFLLWPSLKETVQRLGLQRLRPRSRFNGELGAPDAAAADIALQFAAWIQKSADVAAVLLIRDTDKDEERRRGLEQARILDGHSWPFSIVLGVAHPRREAWVLTGFEAQDSGEAARLKLQQERLGYDPCANSEQLTASSKGAGPDPKRVHRDAKRVLHDLTGGDFEREAQCWRSTPLARLKARGQANGLASYLQELEDQLVPLFSPRSTPRL